MGPGEEAEKREAEVVGDPFGGMPEGWEREAPEEGAEEAGGGEAAVGRVDSKEVWEMALGGVGRTGGVEVAPAGGVSGPSISD